MNKIKSRIIILFIISILLFCELSFGISIKQEINAFKEDDDFYFVQITDTHVMHKIFDRKEISKNRLKSVLAYICSFEKKPAFIVITGDLTEWSGSWISGALNCRAFTSCLYKKDGLLYADENYSIPIYTTPGNHDYFFNRNLLNYKKIINNKTNYVINYNNVSLFFINSGPNYYRELYNWFEKIDGAGLYDCEMRWLGDAFDNCSYTHKIVLMHHPAINERDDNGMMRDVIHNNREAFIDLCEKHNVELVLAGHTHKSGVFDGNENSYNFNSSLNCSLYPTLFVQTDDCKQGIHYRNVTIIVNDIWLGDCIEL